MRLQITAFTHQGAVRPANEDALVVDDAIQNEPMSEPEQATFDTLPLLAAVCDGMGGHAAGEVASQAVAGHLAARRADAGDPGALRQIVVDANEELYALMTDRPDTTGMGTTVAGVVVADQRVLVFNVGDSRVYGLSGTAIEQLSTDDTPGPKLDDGRTAAMTSSVISQVLGGTPVPEPMDVHVLEEPVDARDAWLIVSDGLTDLVDVPGIQACLGDDDALSVRALFEAAMAAGGRDNISIILVRRLSGPSG